MTYKGRVKNGVVVLEEGASLPEGTTVEVSVLSREDRGSEEEVPEKQSLSEFLLNYAGKAKGLPADLAENHDHYLYGTPKKQ